MSKTSSKIIATIFVLLELNSHIVCIGIDSNSLYDYMSICEGI